MRNRRADVVERALDVLDRYGLADLTVRRLASELGLQPSALYHHFASKQALLAAVAEEVLTRRPRRPRPDAWDDRVRVVCSELRDAVLAYRDGAELVATVHAFGMGASAPGRELVEVLEQAGCPTPLARTASRTLLHFVFGHAGDEQAHLQAGSAGAIPNDVRERADLLGPDDFASGLDLVVAGIASRLGAPVSGGR
ncbi:TetR/AcrR family transcriptional regulator C-terminal domain-containing protein [Auraticoccus monumenti]|uniref:Tetracyclin repressor, C-terminal all-alpha domain n=1 Tax=Auraticoccus monumenti TaxID=675864 RepID=A0A1G7ARP6_9ACTN|nr:TetR/AcrR family transcriptional regulator C-terminal domain-containing protein [Auraticoccus monumenti]SDE16675.1 Tetracyclin repressor, C-terminal all-alpha domain [Auraticoccus monumenti]